MPGIRQDDPPVGLAVDDDVGVLREHAAPVQQQEVDDQVLDRLAADARLEAERVAVEVRRPADPLDVGRRHALEPDRLPDPRGPRVPDRVRLGLPVLLAARLREVERVVVRHHRDGLASRRVERERDVGPERRVPAFVRRDEVPVDPDAREVVDGAEVQQDAVVARRRVELALVPAREVEAGVPDPARRRLGRERDLDRQRPVVDVRRPAVPPLVVERETPAAVEARPPGTLELGPRVREGIHLRMEGQRGAEFTRPPRVLGPRRAAA
jgi:hypothetical protein